VTAPIASHVYQIPVEGEVVTPGLSLMSLANLSDTCSVFLLREDLMARLKVRDRFSVKNRFAGRASAQNHSDDSADALPRFPGESRDPLPPWAPAFAGKAVNHGPVNRVNESEH